MDWLVVRVAGRELALDVRRVREILPGAEVTRVPGTARALRGVAPVHGQPIAVVDLALRLGAAADPGRARSPAVVVDARVDGAAVTAALLVDEAGRLAAAAEVLPRPSACAAPGEEALCPGFVVVDGALVPVLDVDAVMAMREPPARSLATVAPRPAPDALPVAPTLSRADAEERVLHSRTPPPASIPRPPRPAPTATPSPASATQPSIASPTATATAIAPPPPPPPATATPTPTAPPPSTAPSTATPPSTPPSTATRTSTSTAILSRTTATAPMRPARDRTSPSPPGASRGERAGVRGGGWRIPLAIAALAAAAVLVLVRRDAPPPAARATAPPPSPARSSVARAAQAPRDEEPAHARAKAPEPIAAPAGPEPIAPPAGRAPLPPCSAHGVARGDTLWAIAGRRLGDPRRWPELFEANRGVVRDPDLILPGERLAVPGRCDPTR